MTENASIFFEVLQAQLTEKVAQVRLDGDRSLEYLMGGAGAVLDANIDLSIRDTTKRAMRFMTVRERDEIVRGLRAAFKGHLTVESDGQWYSGLAAVAAAITENLGQGWRYKP